MGSRIGRPPGDATKRDNVKKSFELALREKELDSSVAESRFEQYMEFYDRRMRGNRWLIDIENDDKPNANTWTKISGEVRQIDRQMMEIEKYFGFKPSEETGDDYIQL